MSTTSAIRFGLGTWDGLRSSSWKVWPGSDSSVYIASRDIGHALKVSLHPRSPAGSGGEWRIAFTAEYLGTNPLQGLDGNRTLDEWDSEIGRLENVPLKQAFAVVLGRFSMGYHVLSPSQDLRSYRRRLAKVDWLQELPPVENAWQFTTFIGDAGVLGTPPGTRAMSAVQVGRFTLGNGAEVWIMRHLIPVTQEMKQNIAMAMNYMVSSLGRSFDPAVYRGHLHGKEPDGLRWMVEIAATHGAPEGALDI